MTSPLRPTIVAETAYPLVLQVSMAVCAIVRAIEAVRSLWVRSSALAGTALAQPITRAQQNIDWVDIVPPYRPPCCGLPGIVAEYFARAAHKRARRRWLCSQSRSL